jgi:glyoxylase-like metal-dependent hydrolase (beta-lactamase superfamily II)
VGAVKEVAAETGCAVYLHEAELSMPPMMTAGKLYYTHTYDEADVLELAGLSVQVLHTPGHTPGSVCLKIENHLFSGDTLFAGSCGRTDLPGGSWKTIQESLRRLAQMEGSYWVHPGHGQSTTLAQEKQYNPYMK